MREVIVKSYCDRCADDEHKVSAVSTFIIDIVVGESAHLVPRMLELCEPHAKEVDALRALIADRGQLPPHVGKPSPKPTTGKPVECPIPDCGHTTANKHSMRDHLRMRHQTTYSALGLSNHGQQARCAECGYLAGNGTGLSAHMRSKHPGVPVPNAKPTA